MHKGIVRLVFRMAQEPPKDISISPDPADTTYPVWGLADPDWAWHMREMVPSRAEKDRQQTFASLRETFVLYCDSGKNTSNGMSRGEATTQITLINTNEIKAIQKLRNSIPRIRHAKTSKNGTNIHLRKAFAFMREIAPQSGHLNARAPKFNIR